MATANVCNANVLPCKLFLKVCYSILATHVISLANGLKAADIQHLLRQRIAVLSGGRDRNGRPVITCPSRENAEKTSFDDLRLVLLYLHAIPR